MLVTRLRNRIWIDKLTTHCCVILVATWFRSQKVATVDRKIHLIPIPIGKRVQSERKCAGYAFTVLNERDMRR